jgi:iron complex outermembrane receptor protein
MWLAKASYTYLHQVRHDERTVYRSNYAMEYLRHKLVVTADWTMWRGLGLNASVHYNDRVGDYTPYATLDLKLRWTEKRYEVWVLGNNITDTHYTDIGGVPQPGIWVTAGLKWRIL